MEVKKSDKPGSLSPVKPALKRDAGDDDRRSRSSSKSEKELRLPPEKSPSDDGSLRRERKLSRASESSRETFERLVFMYNRTTVFSLGTECKRKNCISRCRSHQAMIRVPLRRVRKFISLVIISKSLGIYLLRACIFFLRSIRL